MGRRAAGQGFEQISQQEFAAWQSNYGVRLTPWEIDTLRAIDHVAAQANAAYRATQQS